MAEANRGRKAYWTVLYHADFRRQHRLREGYPPKGDLKHATHLYIKNSFGKLISKVVNLPKGNKPIVIGEEEKKPIKYDPCKFKSICITDREDFKIIFDENNPNTLE